MTLRPGSVTAVALAALLIAGCSPDKTQVSPEDTGDAQPGPSETDGGMPGGAQLSYMTTF